MAVPIDEACDAAPYAGNLFQFGGVGTIQVDPGAGFVFQRFCLLEAVLRDGEKVGELEESELSQSNIMKAIAGGDDKNE